MRIDIITIFPEICLAPLRESIIGRAQETGRVNLRAHDLRDWTHDRHRQVDDLPYGGGPGMVMKPEPFFEAVEALRTPEARVILLTPQGRRFDQAEARRLSAESHLILLCGHYEGIDHRVVEALVDEELSIGDYVLTNGTLAAAVIVDAVVRLLPGVLGDERSAEEESFAAPGVLEGPHYTRPAEFRGMKVPDVLLSGHHARIEAWRRERGLERTRENRPDLQD
ncbi:MAG: tRNA (guanosine(37)-N1)-methyltransferase TrmD [Akkermansiaceae bacterium]|nr:tRNA (guanosine(37)-N1)-methyltransferase TrmD [Verrucomicrobiae bacterium]MCP5553452.1 tRNA (guanosine(37)-N1)-methyltransferase TrmD [Akkermansiaceae bacterium]